MMQSHEDKVYDNSNEIKLATFCHISGMTGYFVVSMFRFKFDFWNSLLTNTINLIPPLIIWLRNKDSSSFVEQHERKVINFLLSISIFRLTFFGISYLFSTIYSPELIDIYLHSVESFSDFLSIDRIFLVTTLMLLLYLFFCLMLYVIHWFCLIMAIRNVRYGAFYNYPLTIPFIQSDKDKQNSNSGQNS